MYLLAWQLNLGHIFILKKTNFYNKICLKTDDFMFILLPFLSNNVRWSILQDILILKAFLMVFLAVEKNNFYLFLCDEQIHFCLFNRNIKPTEQI